jgi:hypothetical protein
MHPDKTPAPPPRVTAPHVPRVPYGLVWFAVALGLSAWAVLIAALYVLFSG